MERGKIFYGIYGIGKIWIVFFLVFCMLRGTQRTLTGVQLLVPRYWSGYQWYRDIRTTLSQRCIAECRVALRAVISKSGSHFFCNC